MAAVVELMTVTLYLVIAVVELKRVTVYLMTAVVEFMRVSVPSDISRRTNESELPLLQLYCGSTHKEERK
jgi:hypothetical protein